MIRSMTAFGSAKKGGFQVEIHSVNRKSLEMSLMLPRGLLFLDPHMRKILAQDIHRGQVTVRVIYNEKEDATYTANSLKILKEKWDKIATDLKLDPRQDVNLEFLVARSLEEPLNLEEKEIEKGIMPLLRQSLQTFIDMREKEGKNLQADVELQLQQIKTGLETIKAKIPDYEKKQAQELKNKIKELSSIQDEDTILKEVAAYINKIDVHEEIVRLYSHISQFEELVHVKKRNIGRILDVLIQEMSREINTLIAKMGDTEILKLAITVKSYCNKIQEQVQNIE